VSRRAVVKPLVRRARADEDVIDAIDHYSNESSATATAFVDALEQAYGHIQRWPAKGSPRYAHALDLPGLRFCRCTRYPYLVFYVEKDDRIEVWRVLHASRDIPQWLQEDDGTHPP
jgi:toxin ParE1/3/4